MQNYPDKKACHRVPDFDLPVLPDSMEKEMKPKQVSFDSYLRSIANSYKMLSRKQKAEIRKRKLAIPPAPVSFEWKE